MPETSSTNTDMHDHVTRRKVLRTSATVGAIGLSGLAAAGPVAATDGVAQGGRGAMLRLFWGSGADALVGPGVAFTITSVDDVVRYDSPCTVGATGLQGTTIQTDEYRDIPMYVSPTTLDQLDLNASYAFVASETCVSSPYVAVDFRPAK